VTAALGRLHVLTDTRQGRDALPVVRAALAAGAPVVQVRAKDGTDRDLFDLAERVARLCDAAGALCLVDDRVDVALAVGAGGTHLGAFDLPLAAARRLAGPDHVLGGTARDPDLAQTLVAQGADYLGVGPTAATATKAGLPAPLGVTAVAAVAAAVDVPVVAIGGIRVEHVPALLAAGVHGVAVVAAVSEAADPAAATRELLAALHAADGAP
jgi:thiamine-phosphate pyrophosphorylase